MYTLLERLRQALAPRYDVERELASGGMGTVFLGGDRALGRRVAIKILRPELATHEAVERFLREARILASLSHPNVVPVHDADEGGGLYYYVMDYLPGETLDDRLTRGPLSWRDALKLGRDLLDGLEVAHRRGVLHRDVKPSNIFLVGNRAVLVDFGIAKSSTDPHGLSLPGHPVGTLGYMPPEQLAAAPVTTRTDLYAAGMVIYEALTRRQWTNVDHPERANWSGIPRRIARVLRRALQSAPDDRWPDAAAFRRALWRTRVWPYRRRTLLLTVGGLVAGGAGMSWWGSRATPCPSLCIEVTPFVQRGVPDRPWIKDSVAYAVGRALQGYPDFIVWGLGSPRSAARHPARALSGVVQVRGDTVQVELLVAGFAPVSRSGAVAEWRRLVDSLTTGQLLEMWRSPLDTALTRDVLPKTPSAMIAFVSAERLFARAQWGEAYRAYAAAAAADSTCWLCYWRHSEAARWLSVDADSSERGRYRARVALFPPWYQSLIRADTMPLTLRLDTLEAATRRWKDFLFGKFRRGDELLHRGPLIGHARREADPPFREVLRQRPGVAPAWDHLAWLWIAEGDAVKAAEALDTLRHVGELRDYYELRVRLLLEAAFVWRFREAAAQRTTEELVRLGDRSGVRELDAGARFLVHFDAPRGAVALGRLLESRPALARSALLAQAFGFVALGAPDSARAALERLLASVDEPNLALFARELDAVLLLFDSDSALAARRWPTVARLLLEQESGRTATAERRRRAAWMLTLLERRMGTVTGDRQRGQALRDEPPPRPLSALLSAQDLAARGRYGRALELSAPLAEYEAARVPDPFYRTVVHLLRAEWYERLGHLDNAQSELLWHENSDVEGTPTGDPQAAEVDWALGTVARWRRAALLGRAGKPAELTCRAYAAVARLWAAGDAEHVARADSARLLLADFRCPAPAPAPP